MHNFESILSLLDEYKHLGYEQLENGTQLIGRAPHVAKYAWLHSLYPPLTDDEIVELEKSLDIPVHDSFKEFLKVSNGLHAFVTTFCIDGLRANYKRDIISSRQPFDITTPNYEERPKDAEKDWLFIGGYDWDGSLLFIKPDGKVYCYSRKIGIYHSWDNLFVMLEEEILRLMKLFDEKGQRYEDLPTTPPISK
jgi:hypothetical protein